MMPIGLRLRRVKLAMPRSFIACLGKVEDQDRACLRFFGREYTYTRVREYPSTRL